MWMKKLFVFFFDKMHLVKYDNMPDYYSNLFF